MKYLPGGIARGGPHLAQQAIKEDNLKRIFLELLRHGEMTRIQISRSTGLSAATVSALVDELVQTRLFVETGPVLTSGIGRKPINLRIRPDSRQLPVFSLERRGVLFTLYGLDCRPVETLFIPHATDRYGGFSGANSGGSPDTGADYANLIRGALAKSAGFDPDRAIALCVVLPGTFVPDLDAYQMHSLRISFSRKVMADLEMELGIPMFLGNTSMARTYAEKKALDALGEQVDDLLYVYVREGVGAGILCGSELFTGADDTAGEIGHMTIDFKGRRCACGNRGCLEQYVNLSAIIERVKRASPVGGGGRPVTLESIRSAYDEGLEGVCRVVDDVAEKLFLGIYGAICLTGIKRIVMGGGIERLGEGFLQKLRSLSEASGDGMPMRRVTIDYARSGPSGDSLGIVHYFLDKAFTIAE